MTTQHLFCARCHEKYPTHKKLFEALYDFSRKASVDCPECGEERELRLTLDFQLGAGDSDFRVVSAYLPDKLESWLGEEEEEVTFYPFLVVLERSTDRKQFCWMPYWHVTGREARYGQHAICLHEKQFESLMSQMSEKDLQPA